MLCSLLFGTTSMLYHSHRKTGASRTHIYFIINSIVYFAHWFSECWLTCANIFWVDGVLIVFLSFFLINVFVVYLQPVNVFQARTTDPTLESMHLYTVKYAQLRFIPFSRECSFFCLLHLRNLKTEVSLWKRIKCFPSALLRWGNLKTQLDRRSFWICFWGKLGQGIRMITVTQSCFQNVFSPHEKAMPGFSSSSGLKRVFESSFFVTD